MIGLIKRNNPNYQYFLKLPLNIFEDIKFVYVRKHYKKGATYLVAFLKLTLQSLPSGWISYEEIKEELRENTDEFVKELVRLQMLERVDNMYHSYLVENNFVHAHPTDIRDRNTIQYLVWRKSVFERDKYTCQMCGEYGGKLNAHHIIRWCDDLNKRYEVANGITLCEKCHKEKHREERMYGKAKNV